eukprot:CAMPEP_0119558996 /NCGR_PEP_ID=MMETSP1352-20130426/11738_1 /TAXON_ID=265584 /ORGANISM="Stauroneis constricta, Strain CCMP1120" /LENGTH=740 /DNA_ID=CAMNT_0007606533 /DNA_START=110 /DNA_END=2332 /DNA_ORIENTATION=+
MSAATAADDASKATTVASSATFWQEPIVVGYAFGPKKMSTMGTVMAEASKTEVLWELEHEDSEEDDEDDDEDDGGDDGSNDHDTQQTLGYHDDGHDDSALKRPTSPLHQSQHEDEHENGDCAASATTTSQVPNTASDHDHEEGHCHCVNSSSNDTTAGSGGGTCANSSAEHAATCRSTAQQHALTAESLDQLEPPTQTVIFSIGKYNPEEAGGGGSNSNGGNNNSSNGGFGNGFVTTNLKHIVRYFQSSCSSAGGSVVAEDELSAAPTMTSATTGTSWTTALHRDANSTTAASGGSVSKRRSLAPIRLKFVPLDPNIPLHEQGEFDLILHKLTEDILSCSLQQQHEARLLRKGAGIAAAGANDAETNTRTWNVAELSSPQSPSSPPQIPQPRLLTKVTSQSTQESQDRVQRLLHYKANHPQCCLVDHPQCVQTLMSRSDIAHVLRSCLDGVTSASGRSVRTPRYVVVEDESVHMNDRNNRNNNNNHNRNTTTTRQDRIQQQLDDANMSYPLIVKPLIAAGTKHSHYMSVLLGYSALSEFDQEDAATTTPAATTTKTATSATTTNRSYLFQEYVNHNATLYKVYVLGDTVHVYQRHSLPDLPSLEQRSDSNDTWCVQFDSQRPYPKLQDFGFDVNDSDNNYNCSINSSNNNHDDSTNVATSIMTQREVRPIVETLRQAFGLELFGFDILLCDEQNELLVVDVNYFPSYKEVPKFPSLLAQYLTQRVLEARRERDEVEVHER